ncbi:MAG: STAS domain-containing protein [Magnetococcales bacterium]|nr:STAS domain-containing protein [Magnetococcales bacterium]
METALTQKQNCWEVKKCGREPGGAKVAEMGICPASNTKTGFINHGEFAGRICWAITGTFCGGKQQGTREEKSMSCTKCEFYLHVKEEEGSGFKLLPPEEGPMVTISAKKGKKTEVGLRLVERFDHNVFDGFEKAFNGMLRAKKDETRYVLDFKRTTYLDSAALGMMLLFREKAGGPQSDIHLVNVRPAVRQVLDTANFQKLFHIR